MWIVRPPSQGIWPPDLLDHLQALRRVLLRAAEDCVMLIGAEQALAAQASLEELLKAAPPDWFVGWPWSEYIDALQELPVARANASPDPEDVVDLSDTGGHAWDTSAWGRLQALFQEEPRPPSHLPDLTGWSERSPWSRGELLMSHDRALAATCDHVVILDQFLGGHLVNWVTETLHPEVARPRSNGTELKMSRLHRDGVPRAVIYMQCPYEQREVFVPRGRTTGNAFLCDERHSRGPHLHVGESMHVRLDVIEDALRRLGWEPQPGAGGRATGAETHNRRLAYGFRTLAQSGAISYRVILRLDNGLESYRPPPELHTDAGVSLADASPSGRASFAAGLVKLAGPVEVERLSDLMQEVSAWTGIPQLSDRDRDALYGILAAIGFSSERSATGVADECRSQGVPITEAEVGVVLKHLGSSRACADSREVEQTLLARAVQHVAGARPAPRREELEAIRALIATVPLA